MSVVRSGIRWLGALVILAGLPSLSSAHPSWSIAHDRARGLVYYSDLRQVWSVDAAFTRRLVVPNVHTHELLVDAEGNLYGEDARVNGRHRVWRRSPGGVLADLIPDSEGYRDDWGFVEGPGGALYWAKCEKLVKGRASCGVRRRLPGGRIEDAARGARFGHPLNFLSRDADGRILIGDGPDVKRLKPDDSVEVVARGVTRATDRFAFMGFHTADDGALYLAAFGDRTIVRVSKEGTRSIEARSATPWSPTGVLKTTQGLWILEFEGARARLRFRPTKGAERVFPVSP